MIKELQYDAVRQFIRKFEDEDAYNLSLKASNFKDIAVHLAIEQIKVRQKAKKKLPEWHQTEGLIFPHGVSIEQCSSEVTAKYKSTLIKGTNLVDLTGGSGVDTAYLSQNFTTTQFVEPSKELCVLAGHNFEVLTKSIKIHQSTAEEFVSNQNDPPDWYFLDPSRRKDANQRVFLLSDCQPDLELIKDQLLRARHGVMIKLSPLLDLAMMRSVFPNLTSVHIVSVENDCKELLLILEKKTVTELLISTVNFHGNSIQAFQFYQEEEKCVEAKYSDPLNYLYEPNSAILKAGAFKKIGFDFNLKKLHPNSHLYTSMDHLDDFPGRAFKIHNVIALKAKAIKQEVGTKANISTRNFPLTVAQIRKKTGLQDGGAHYLFATTLFDGSHKVLICSKV